jgi:hypothetical protein
MAVFQVLAYFVPDVARRRELARNPVRVIGFHLLSVTPVLTSAKGPGMVLSAAQRPQGTLESAVRGAEQSGKALRPQHGAGGRRWA